MKKIFALIALTAALTSLAGCTKEDKEPAETTGGSMEIIAGAPEDDELDWGELVPAE